jgi:tetratricopeptide (TPR) repeat protein/LPS sulfotransferase NodH
MLSQTAISAFSREKQRCLAILKTNAGTGLVALRDLVRAFPQVAEAHYLLAVSTEQTPPGEEILSHAAMAVKLAPDNSDYAHLLGIMYYQLELFEMAVPVFRKVISLSPSNFAAFNLMALCYENMGMGHEALVNFEKALQANPPASLRDEIIMNMADSAETSNRPERAFELYSELATRNSEYRHWALGFAAWNADRHKQEDVLKELDKALKTKDLEDTVRSLLLLAKGRILDRQEQHDLAFRAWAGARKYSRKGTWRIKDHNREFEERANFYDKALCAVLESRSSTGPDLAVICGMPRSGTTLIEQIISAHGAAAGIGEFGRWVRLESYIRGRRFTALQSGRISNEAWIAELSELADETSGVMREIVGKPADMIVEKLPHNFMNVGFIRMLFPAARFIHVRRDPLDTFISSYQNPLNDAHGYAYDQVEYAREFLFQERFMTHWKALFPDQIYTLHYEQLAQDPETQARALLDFLGLPWEDAVLQFHTSNKTVRTISKDQVRNPVNTKSVGRWKLYDKHLGPLKNALAQANFTYPDYA